MAGECDGDGGIGQIKGGYVGRKRERRGNVGWGRQRCRSVLFFHLFLLSYVEQLVVEFLSVSFVSDFGWGKDDGFTFTFGVGLFLGKVILWDVKG